MADNDFQILDPGFRSLVKTSAAVRQLYTGCAWAEGPVYLPTTRQVVWSDIPNDRMLAFNEVSEATTVFRSPANFSNGNTLDQQGRLITCEHGSRSVTRTELNGRVVPVATCHNGRQLNSPNDVVVKSDGSIWFSDPTYGIDSDYEGHKAAADMGACNLYELRADGQLRIAAADFVQPNGLAFSRNETILYVSDTGASHKADGPRHLRQFSVGADNSLTGGSVFAECTAGAFDGFCIDSENRIWASAADGVHCYDPHGTLLGKVLVPERVANVTFGGVKRNILYICATSSLYAVRLAVNG